MRTLFLPAFAVTFLGLAAPAAANDRTDAIALCRAEISRQTGAEEAQIRVDQTRTRGRTLRVDLDLWREGRLTNVRCNVDTQSKAIASIEPALQAAVASARER